jgi:hypothetical protein
MAVVAVGVQLEERRTLAATRALDIPGRRRVHRAHVLTVDHFTRDPKARGRSMISPGGGLGVVRVLVVHVVLARVDDRQLPQLRHVHLFVEHTLAKRALAEEADRHAIVLQILRRERGAGSDAGTAANDRIGAKVAGLRIGDVHRAALALAVARLLAQELGEHQMRLRALGETVPVAAMRARVT